MGAPFACHRFVDDNQPDASTATANRSNACLSALAEDNACNTVSGLATANEMDTIVLPAAAIAPAKAARSAYALCSESRCVLANSVAAADKVELLHTDVTRPA